MMTRRQALMSLLFGTGLVGLRALATGLPAAFFLNPRRAWANSTCAPSDKAQYFIFNTSGSGDPLNASVPGTYDDPNIVHSLDPSMQPTPITIGGQNVTAALPWASLAPSVLERTCFFHLMTNTPIHPKEPDVLKLMGATRAGQMLPSLLAKRVAACLGTIQTQPISLGASSPAEALSYDGTALPIIPPLALKSTLTSPAGPLTNLQPLRDQTLSQIYELYKTDATAAERKYIDNWTATQQQARSLNQSLLSALNSIKDNSVQSQIVAAIVLIQMNVTPVIAVHIPFGGDNHRDIGLAIETQQTVSGVASLVSLMQQLSSAGLNDRVSFASLNVFGRTLGRGNADGRQHNPNHQVSLLIGKPFRGGVVGGVASLKDDYGALPIDAASGAGLASGNISPADTLASFGRTLLASVGTDSASIATEIPSGQVVQGALA